MSVGTIVPGSTDTANRVATARWCSESARPFTVVKDRCYKWLQREGRPDRYIPTREQVSKDVGKLYKKSKKRLASELQVVVSFYQIFGTDILWFKACEGELAIALDCWTSPNHRPWMSISVSRLRKREDGVEEPITHVLDFIELPCSHTGRNMAECVVRVLEEYGIQNKVSIHLLQKNNS